MSVAMVECPLSVGREMHALAALKAGIEAQNYQVGDQGLDPRFLADLAEGQTNLFEAIDVLLRDDLADTAMIEGLKLVLADLGVRRMRLESRVETRRALLEQALTILECKGLERPSATITLARRAQALVVADESQIPSAFFQAKPILDRKALKVALERGDPVSGAHLSNGPITLTIRRR